MRPAATLRRSGQRLVADPSRVVLQLFVPGHAGAAGEGSRAQAVVQRLLALDEAEVELALGDVVDRFATRHRDLEGAFRRHAAVLADRLDARTPPLSPARTLLLGATFTSEYALEGAALCNPSIIADPDQDGVAAGALRIVLSVRAIGEGHRSSIGFRSGVVDAVGEVVIDAPTALASSGQVAAAEQRAAVFRAELDPSENVDYVLEGLGPRFDVRALQARLESLRTHTATRDHVDVAIGRITALADRCYTVTFDPEVPLGERVLRPATAVEAHGVEDARFLRLTMADGSTTLAATYTAYDGVEIRQQVLVSDDLRTFTSRPLVGAAAANKGLALFPRPIGGRYAALSRADRESNSVAFSDDLHVWPAATPVQVPARPWELLQLGNCGPPIETTEGWLVLTHGVGPMRTYRIGAILLDLDDPTVVRGQLRDPLLVPAADERDGYVPNVVYSCGALVHAGVLVVPYGIGDAAVGVATVPLDDVLGALLASG